MIFTIPPKRLSKAAVMKMLKTLMKTFPLKMAVIDPEGSHAIITIVWTIRNTTAVNAAV